MKKTICNDFETVRSSQVTGYTNGGPVEIFEDGSTSIASGNDENIVLGITLKYVIYFSVFKLMYQFKA